MAQAHGDVGRVTALWLNCVMNLITNALRSLQKLGSQPIISITMARLPPMPTELLTLGRRVLRPRDAAGVYHNPAGEFRRLARGGALRRVAHGYYLLPPQEAAGDLGWRPEVEHLALGIAVADHGDRAALMGLSAARYHGAVPRAHATGWVAVAVSRRPLDCGRYGQVVFVRRDLDGLDLVAARTPITDGWVTSVEQTVVDLARRPNDVGGIEAAAQIAAVLLDRADETLVDELARAQRARSALARLRHHLTLR